jgi:hypothetical protein|tara:strand:+ start:1553 stop:1744 length:192 start_codon:yes stop_codon:yes gene_type:complete
MTDSQLFKHLRTMHYTKTENMNLRQDERTHYNERDILEELYHRGYTHKQVVAIRHGLESEQIS